MFNCIKLLPDSSLPSPQRAWKRKRKACFHWNVKACLVRLGCSSDSWVLGFGAKVHYFLCPSDSLETGRLGNSRYKCVWAQMSCRTIVCFYSTEKTKNDIAVNETHKTSLTVPCHLLWYVKHFKIFIPFHPHLIHLQIWWFQTATPTVFDTEDFHHAIEGILLPVIRTLLLLT